MTKFFGLLLIAAIVFFLAQKYRGLIIAGSVNSTPIYRLSLEKQLNARYAQATLDELINTALLKDLAKTNDITISTNDISDERKQIEDRLGGAEALRASLDQYGMSESEFNSRLETVVLERKLSEKLFTNEVSDEDAQKYFDDNKVSFSGKKFPDVKDQIKENLKQQKLQQDFSNWFNDQKSKAQIKTYI